MLSKIHKILIIGYGSIGRKHAKILKKFNCQIVIFSSQKNIPFKVIKKKQEIIRYNPDYIIIANNTNIHLNFVKLIEKNFKKKIVLIEKPIFHKYQKIKLTKNNYIVGYNLRFHPMLNFLKKIIKKDDINFISINASSYLPDWRSNINYRKSNSAQKKLGGGILLELSHELDYVRWLFGKIKIFYSYNKKISQLKIDTDDILILFGKIGKKIKIIFNMNFFSRFNKREIVIDGNKYSIRADLIKNNLTFCYKNKKKQYTWKKFNILDTYYKEHEKVFNKDFSNFCDVKSSLELMQLVNQIKGNKQK